MSKAMFQESRGERLSNWATDCHVQEEKGTQQVLALSAPTDQFLEGSRKEALPIDFTPGAPIYHFLMPESPPIHPSC